MTYPIVAYGHPILRKKCEEIDIKSCDLPEFIASLYETMYSTNGVGLAAPQVSQSQRVFVIDSTQIDEDDDRRAKDEIGLKSVFINPIMIEEFGEIKSLEEGCLSIPKVYGQVERPSKIKLKYYNDAMELVEKEFDGFTARVIQHEYDHIEGILFTDKLKPIKRQMLKRKLENIKLGKISQKYKMIFAKIK